MADPTSIPAPNYTQIPNVILDLMADMSNAELRVVIAIARQTFGWHKKRDKISLSQLMKLTGMSRQGVVNGLDAGIERGLIERTPDPKDKRGGIWYRLLVNDVDQSSTLTSKMVDQSTTLTRTSQRTRPELVNVLDTQKKEKEKKERGGDEQTKGSAPAHFFQKLAEICNIPLAVASPGQKAELGTVAAALNAGGATVEQLDAFAAWWWSDNNWRTRKANQAKRKPEAPRPREVREEWGNAVLPAANGHKPSGRGPPVAAQPWKPPDDALSGAALQEAIAARMKKRE